MQILAQLFFAGVAVAAVVKRELVVRDGGAPVPVSGWGNSSMTEVHTTTYESIEIEIGTGGESATTPAVSLNSSVPAMTTTSAMMAPIFAEPVFTGGFNWNSTAATSVPVGSVGPTASAPLGSGLVSTMPSVTVAPALTTSDVYIPMTPTPAASSFAEQVITVIPIIEDPNAPVSVGESVTTIIRTTFVTVIDSELATLSTATIVTIPGTQTIPATFSMVTTVVPLGDGSATLVVPEETSTTTVWATVTSFMEHFTTATEKGTVTETTTPTVYTTITGSAGTAVSGYPGTAVSGYPVSQGTGLVQNGANFFANNTMSTTRSVGGYAPTSFSEVDSLNVEAAGNKLFASSTLFVTLLTVIAFL